MKLIEIKDIYKEGIKDLVGKTYKEIFKFYSPQVFIYSLCENLDGETYIVADINYSYATVISEDGIVRRTYEVDSIKLVQFPTLIYPKFNIGDTLVNVGYANEPLETVIDFEVEYKTEYSMDGVDGNISYIDNEEAYEVYTEKPKIPAPAAICFKPCSPELAEFIYHEKYEDFCNTLCEVRIGNFFTNLYATKRGIELHYNARTDTCPRHKFMHWTNYMNRLAFYQFDIPKEEYNGETAAEYAKKLMETYGLPDTVNEEIGPYELYFSEPEDILGFLENYTQETEVCGDFLVMEEITKEDLIGILTEAAVEKFKEEEETGYVDIITIKKGTNFLEAYELLKANIKDKDIKDLLIDSIIFYKCPNATVIITSINTKENIIGVKGINKRGVILNDKELPITILKDYFTTEDIYISKNNPLRAL